MKSISYAYSIYLLCGVCAVFVMKRKLGQCQQTHTAKKTKRSYGTKFEIFTCELDSDYCQNDDGGLCTQHKTPAGNSKVGRLVNFKVAAKLSCGSNKKVKFECDVCLHTFESSLSNVNNGRWCGMCSTMWKHCGTDECTFCYERSFASYAGLTSNDKKKVDCIVNKANLRLPLNNGEKGKFECDVCLHTFESRLHDVNNGTWCGMCSTKWKHCGTDECTFCYERSFASYAGLTSNDKKKVDCIVNKANLRLPLNNGEKGKFECDVCLHTFESRLHDVNNGTWCPHCKNKTELKVFNFLTKELELRVKREYNPSFQWRDYKKRCRFDFLLVDLDIILEIDGPQHTEEVANTWIRPTLLHPQLLEFFMKEDPKRQIHTALFHRQIVDKWKEFMARRDGKKLFRFNQCAIWMDSYDWKREMRILVNNI